jgi:hypothetical protein
MKTLKNRLKPIALFLTTLLLFQSCVVYHKTPTTIQQASQEQIRTKIIKTNGEISKYKYITFEDDIFYGVKLKSGEWIKTPLDQKEIAQVLTKNISTSKTLTIVVLSLVGLYIVGAVIYVSGIAH